MVVDCGANELFLCFSSESESYHIDGGYDDKGVL